MQLNPDFQINPDLYIRDPKSSELGKRILKHAAAMIEQIGLEDFTFKKLAKELATTESSIYRYFENKQLLLLYLLSWYWQWLEYLIVYRTNNLTEGEKKIDIMLDVLLLNLKGDGPSQEEMILHLLVIKESSKSYLHYDVKKFNEKKFYKPYKDLCAHIASIFLELNPKFKYSRNLASTVLLMSRNLYFFMQNLPSLTDFPETKDIANSKSFLKKMILSTLLHEE